MDAFLDFLANWGLSGLIIAAVAFGLTQLVKIPIKRWASAKFGDDNKKKVTKWLVFFPIVFAFLGSVIDTWIRAAVPNAPFEFGFDWMRVLKETAGCMAFPALIVSIKENFQEDHDAALLKNLTEGTDEEKVKAQHDAIEKAKANAIANKDAKAAEKAEREAKAIADRKAKLEAKRQAEIKRLEEAQKAYQAKIDALKKPVTDVPTEPLKEAPKDGEKQVIQL